MYVSISPLLLIALACHHTDARLSGNRELIGGLEGLQTHFPTPTTPNGQDNDDPDSDSLLGAGGHGQQITDPNQFDDNGNAIFDNDPFGEGSGSGTNDPDDLPLLGGGGHGQEITDPNQFDDNGNAIYDNDPFGEGSGSGTNDEPLLGGGGHGQQITDPNQFDDNGNAIYDNDPFGEGSGSGTNDEPLLGGGGHGQQITDPNQFDDNGNAIYGNPMNTSDVDGFDGSGGDSSSGGMGNMTIDNMDMMNGLNDTESGNQGSSGVDGDLNGDNGIDGFGDTDDFNADVDIDGTDEGIFGDENEDKNFGFPWDLDGSSAPSPAFGGGAGGAGFPSIYGSPSPAPIGEDNFGRPTFGQDSYGPLPTLAPTSSDTFSTWDYTKPTSKPVVYIPPEEKEDNDNTGAKDDKDDYQGDSSIKGTGGIGDYLYFDHGEPIEEMEHDRNVAIALGICGGIGLCLAIITAQQMLENPNGCCAGMCRILVATTCGVTRCIFWPCRKICGCTGSTRQERYSNELISGGGYNEHYISDLEMT